MATKAERLKALIYHYANNSRVVPPTPVSIQWDIQEVTGTLYGLDTIARYLCDWYITKDSQNKTSRYAKSQRKIEAAIASLDAALESLKSLLKQNF